MCVTERVNWLFGGLVVLMLFASGRLINQQPKLPTNLVLLTV